MAKYEDTPLTNFPDSEDNWARMSDITATLLSVALQYNSLWEAGQIDEANALLEANPALKNTIFNADKWNKIRDAIIALERYYLNDVTEFIEQTAQAAIGINDNPLEQDKNLVAYSAEKVESFIKDIEKVVTVTFPTSGWSGTNGDYEQTINVSEVTSEDEPLLVKYRSGDFNESDVKAYNKAFGILADGEGITGNGIVTWKCLKKPAIDITVGLKGLKADLPSFNKADFSNMTFNNETPNENTSGEYYGEILSGDLEVSNTDNSQAYYHGKIEEGDDI